MRSYSNSTTRRLEGFARNHGAGSLNIVISTDNSAGRYFATGRNGKPWARWMSLGWTVTEAQEALADISSDEAADAQADADWEREMLETHRP